VINAKVPRLALAGIEGFEGLIHGSSDTEGERLVGAFLDFLIEIAVACWHEGLFRPGPVILSAGGSKYYDLVADRFSAAGIGETKVVMRSGCYLTQDSTAYRKAFQRILERSPKAAGLEGGLRSALEVWTYVQSRPEPERLILTAGKRDLSYDDDLPVPL